MTNEEKLDNLLDKSIQNSENAQLILRIYQKKKEKDSGESDDEELINSFLKIIDNIRTEIKTEFLTKNKENLSINEDRLVEYINNRIYKEYKKLEEYAKKVPKEDQPTTPTEEEVDSTDDNQPITFELLNRTVDFINQLKPYEQVLFVYKNKIGKKCFQNIFKLNVFIDAILQPSCGSLCDTYKFHQQYNFRLTRYKVENYLPKEVTKQNEYINKLNDYNEIIRPKTEEICKQLQQVLYPCLKEFFDNIRTPFESEQLEQSTTLFKKILQPCWSTKKFYKFFEFQLRRKYENRLDTESPLPHVRAIRPEYTSNCEETINFLKTELENFSTTTVPSSNDFEKSICEAVVKMDTNTPEIIFMHNRLNRLYEAYIATPT